MFCKECGTKHPRFVNYCPNDGEQLIAALPNGVSHKTSGFCGGCGNQVNSTAQYCQNCGDSYSTLKIGTAKAIQPTKASRKSFAPPAITNHSFTKNTFIAAISAAAVSIILILLTGFFLKAEIESAIVSNSDGEITKAQLQSIESYFAEAIEYDYEINLDLPNIYNTFTYISVMHGIDFEFNGEASERESDFFQGSIDINAQNFSSPLLVLVFFVLLISGVSLGYFTKKNNGVLWQSILTFSLIYGVFLAISSMIASFKYKNEFETYYADLALSFEGKFPLFESLISGFILALAIAGSAALFAMYGKSTFDYLRTQVSYIQYASYSLFLVLIGLFSITAITFFALATSPAAENLLEYFDMTSTILFGSFSMWVWDLAHLLPITFTGKEYGVSDSYSFHLLNSFGDNQADMLYLFFEEEAFPLWIKLSFLLPAILIAIAGYHLYQTHQLRILELLKFSAFYGGMMVIVKLFTSLQLDVSVSSFDEPTESLSLILHTELFSVFFISALFALAFFSAGGFLKRYLSEA